MSGGHATDPYRLTIIAREDGEVWLTASNSQRRGQTWFRPSEEGYEPGILHVARRPIAEFFAKGAAKTPVTIEWQPIPDTTEQPTARFVKGDAMQEVPLWAGMPPWDGSDVAEYTSLGVIQMDSDQVQDLAAIMNVASKEHQREAIVGVHIEQDPERDVLRVVATGLQAHPRGWTHGIPERGETPSR